MESLIKEELNQEEGANLNSNPVSLEDQSAVFYEIVYLPDNQICVDCGNILMNLKILKVILRKELSTFLLTMQYFSVKIAQISIKNSIREFLMLCPLLTQERPTHCRKLSSLNLEETIDSSSS